MNRKDFWEKYKDALKQAPVDALIELYSRVTSKHATRDEAFKDLLEESKGVRGLFKAYIGGQKKFIQIIKDNTKSEEFFQDLRSLASREFLNIVHELV